MRKVQAVSAVSALKRSGAWLWSLLCHSWNWTGANAEQIKIAFAVVAAMFVLQQYLVSVSDAAIKRTLEFQSRYSTGDVAAAHLDLDLLLLSPANKKMLDQAVDPSSKITEFVQANKLERSVLVMTDFYSQLTTCVQQGICQLETACAVFKSRVYAHRNNFYDLVEIWDKEWGTKLMEPNFVYFRDNCAAKRWRIFSALSPS